MSTPSRQWSAASAATVTEWQQNPRLRYAVYALLAILWLYGVLVLKDVVTQKRQTWQATERRATQARQLAGSGDWAARANEIKASLADAESLLWKEGSLGLSRAAVQEAINRNLAAAGLSARQVRVSLGDAAAADLPDIIPIRARVSVDFRADALYTWLGFLAKDAADKKPALIVESLTVRSQPTPIVDIDLVGYALKPQGKDGLSKDGT